MKEHLKAKYYLLFIKVCKKTLYYMLLLALMQYVFCYRFGFTSVDISNKIYSHFHGIGIELFTKKRIPTV